MLTPPNYSIIEVNFPFLLLVRPFTPLPNFLHFCSTSPHLTSSTLRRRSYSPFLTSPPSFLFFFPFVSVPLPLPPHYMMLFFNPLVSLPLPRLSLSFLPFLYFLLSACVIFFFPFILPSIQHNLSTFHS